MQYAAYECIKSVDSSAKISPWYDNVPIWSNGLCVSTGLFPLEKKRFAPKSGTAFPPQIIHFPDPLFTSQDSLTSIFPGWYDTPMQYTSNIGDMARLEGYSDSFKHEYLEPVDVDVVNEGYTTEILTDYVDMHTKRQSYWPGTVSDIGIVKMGEVPGYPGTESIAKVTLNTHTPRTLGSRSVDASDSNDFMISPILPNEKRIFAAIPRCS